MIVISKATLNDLDSLVPLFDAYRQFYGQLPDLEGARTFLSGRMERGESVVFLAFEEDRAVGFTQLYPQFSSVGMDRNWLLNDLYVDERARKKGWESACWKLPAVGDEKPAPVGWCWKPLWITMRHRRCMKKQAGRG